MATPEDTAIWKALDDLKPTADYILKDHCFVSPCWDESSTPGVKQIIDQDFTEAQEA
jgi:hypothetical protein